MSDLANLERKLHACQVVLWLKNNFAETTGGLGHWGTEADPSSDEGQQELAGVSKGVVYRAYVDMCGCEGRPVLFTRPVMGKMVKRAFPQVRTKRRGPRARVAQYYVGLRHRRDGTAQVVAAAGLHNNGNEHDERASEMRPGSSGSSEDLLAFTLPFFELLAEEPRSKPATSSGADCAAEERTSFDQGCVKTEGDDDLLEALERQWDWEPGSGATRTGSSTTDDRLGCAIVSAAHTWGWVESLVEVAPLRAKLPPPEERRNSLLEWAGQVIPPLLPCRSPI